MRFRYAGLCLLVLLSGLLLTARLLGAESYEVTIERDVTAKMRDGVILRADIYRPKSDGRFPVLLQRTPYGKTRTTDFGLMAAARGYIVIVQDVRGRYMSEGDWYTFKNESDDGYDTVEWAASLPYSNGKVGMFGESYVGATQWLTAIAHPPHLAGICPGYTASNYHDGWTYQAGAFEQWFNESWTSILAQDTLHRAAIRNTNAFATAWKLPLANYPLFNFPDPSSASTSTGSLAPYFLDWLAHPAYDAYWKQISIEEHYDEITVPALTVAAWYDIFLGGSLRNYLGMKAHGGTDAARRGQHLLIVVGGHAGAGRKIGDVDFGPAAAEDDLDAITLKWYDFLFKGLQNEFSGKPVKIFVMGDNRWREEEDWPLARAQTTKYFFHSVKGANSLRGDGSLSTTQPRSENPDHYVYDPANPVSTIGGPLCCDEDRISPGPHDQRPAETRDDVLIYSTAPFAQDTEITGPVTVELFAKSSAVDTDFTAKLVDVAPDGYAQNLTEGVIRTRYRDSQDKANLMNPGQIYQFKIDLWATSNVFRKGHLLRVEISSSNFPRFDRNLNTGENAAFAVNLISATNTVYHDADHPSVLVLSVVPSR
jgi:uncharacterized protein